MEGSIVPVISGTTKDSKQVWASPDGQKKIFKITLDVDGQPMQASTYSDAIANVGWSGELDTYEKEGKFGSETFVRQPKKEGFGGFGGGKSYGGSKPQGDQYTMYLSYAKDIVVAQIAQGAKLEFADAIQLVIGGGHELYESRPGATATSEAPKTEVVSKNELDSLFSEPESQWKS
jgi:hypothetical protein